MSFVPRLSRPEAGNKYYITKSAGGWSDAIKGSPTDSSCNVLANCVGYAYGRFNEIAGEGSCKYLRPVNAENFIQYAGGLSVGQEPKLGACMVWQKGATLQSGDGAGHVAIVEQIISSTEIVTSESGWKASKPFWTQTRKKGNGNWGQGSAYKFLGFIYNPAVTTEKGSVCTMGSKITTGKQLAEAALNVAKNYKTLYVMGCFGAPMNATNKKRYTQNHSYNKAADRTKMINAASADTFGFDCVNLIKGLLWGWSGDASKTYGGAGYTINGVPDISADQMIKVCSSISTDFKNIAVGEAVWMSGHIGIYIGDGLAVECTPKWKNCVQVTACNCTKSGYNRRDWTKHGKLPYVTYDAADTGAVVTNTSTTTTPNNQTAAGGGTMTKEEFKKLFSEMRSEWQDNDCGTWSQTARDWAISNGLIAGGGKLPDGTPNYMWADMLTREQAVQLFYRFAQMMGKA